MRAVQLVVIALGAGLGVFYPFLAVILSGRGLDPGAIGLVFAVSAVGFTVAVPLWGHLADVRLGRARALIVCAVGAGAAVLLLLAPLPSIGIAACVIVFSFFESAWQPLGDAISINAVADRRRDYARIRVLTSISFALVAIGAGQLYDLTGYGPAPILFAVCALLMAIAAWYVPDIDRADLDAHASGPATPSVATADVTRPHPPRPPRRPTWRFGSTGVALRLEPRLGLVMLAVGLVHVGIMGGFTFLPLRLVALGGSPGDVALMSGLSAAAEIPAMLLAATVATRIGLRGMFVGAAVLYGACIVSWMVIDMPVLLIATRALTGVAFAGLIVSIVLTIATLLPATLQATGQALYQTIGFGVAAIVGNALGGLVFGSLGHEAFFAMGAALAFVAAGVGWVVVPGRAGPAPAVAAAR
jgi:PPP family 3-phenylpropionic acid transporter